MTGPRFSVVIPACNRPDMLAACLETLRPALLALPPGSLEIIVTDDGTAPSAQPLVAARFPFARWTPGPRRGPAANRNHGASVATGDWLVFTDDDCLPISGWLPAYAAALARTPAATVLEGPTHASGPRLSIDSEAPVNTHGGYLWSCNFAIRRDLFLSLCGFDESFPSATMEDVELHTRLKHAGHLPLFVPDALVHHPWRPRKGLRFLRAYARSVDYYARKHPAETALFAPAVQLRILARSFLVKLPRALRLYGPRGLLRSAALDTCSCFLVSRDTLRRRLKDTSKQ